MPKTIWIVDEVWDNYRIEKELIAESLSDYAVRFSNKSNYLTDIDRFGGQVDALIAQIDIDISGDMLEKLPNCKIISVYGTGYDQIDVSAANEKNILVANVPDYCIDEVSDHILAFIFHFSKKVSSYKDRVRKGLWGIDAVDRLPTRLHGSTVFIVGFGKIGRAVATKTAVLGLNIITFDPYIADDDLKPFQATRVAWETGFKRADYVVVTLRLTEDTRGLIGKTEFDAMQRHAVLINTSRGEILREDELIKAVENGDIGGAALDVLSREPPERDDPMLHCEGILVTPHVSYLTKESLAELRMKTVNNVISLLRDNHPLNVVKA